MDDISWLLILLHILTVFAENDTGCIDFPDCEYKALLRVKRQSVIGPDFRGAYDCMDLICLCPYFKGTVDNSTECILSSGQPLARAVRKELRALTDIERTRLFNAFNILKKSGDYDKLSAIHRSFSKDSGAHFGPSFLIWHREFLKRFEIALRLIDTSVAIPYWDSIMDSYLPEPTDSMMWTNHFVGETDSVGHVINGPFANFTTLELHSHITRNLGKEGHLFTESNIKDFLAQNKIENILAATAPKRGCPYRPYLGAIEYRHASVHLWVGGDMKPPSTAANDPVFFFHHGFVDFVYELWRERKQDRRQRETEFPLNDAFCQDRKHFSSSTMHPFGKKNIEGLSNSYTDFLYTYAPHPRCTHSVPDCKSPYLFCDLNSRNPRCVSKIRLGGRCDGFEGEDACFEGVCINSRCQQKNFFDSNRAVLIPNQFNQVRRKQSNRKISNPVKKLRPDEECLNYEPCCGIRASRGECAANMKYMKKICRRSCGFCKRSDSSDDCVDRHHMCSIWSSSNQCYLRQRWMAENCRSSCGWCHLSVEQLCYSTSG